MRKSAVRVLCLTLCTALLLTATSCSRERSMAAPEPASATAQSKLVAEPSAPGQSASPTSDAVKRLVVREATLKLRTPRPNKVVEAAPGLAQRFDGFVVKSELSRVGETSVEANVVLRVSAERLDAALAELRKLGEVLSESITGEDVTAEFVDVQARLKAKRVLEERLLAIATASGKIDDMLKVESELARVRGEIEQLEGRSRYLEQSARLSSIHVTAVSPSQPTEAAGESFGSKMRKAWSRAGTGATEVLAGLVVLAGVLVPLVVVALLVVVPIVIARRRWRHRHRRKLEEAMAEDPAPGESR
ncbi:MAG: DUF4349 domain-containing protein [Polyangiaceae bacterium]|nr:DUF4349 domain-containing protein [Polyangiaceae bacterium]